MRCEGAQRARTRGKPIGAGDYLDFRAGPALDKFTQHVSTDDKRKLKLMRPDGITLFDNVIRDVLVLDLADDAPDTDVIRARISGWVTLRVSRAREFRSVMASRWRENDEYA